ncbi:hypothetical protein OCD64_26855 [Bacillus toyonensis]|uniref:hypothetical protein n=1 Tax=Bacillus toyonensis TaxID=155322 RepID=UPI0015D4FA05|nr:hypothetical protein [Bacillus toyonensis]MCU4970564.1 hypothetical protein [Bacillus toyonensis]
MVKSNKQFNSLQVKIVTDEKYAPIDFVYGTLTAVTGGTTKVIGHTLRKMHRNLVNLLG